MFVCLPCHPVDPVWMSEERILHNSAHPNVSSWFYVPSVHTWPGDVPPSWLSGSFMDPFLPVHLEDASHSPLYTQQYHLICQEGEEGYSSKWCHKYILVLLPREESQAAAAAGRMCQTCPLLLQLIGPGDSRHTIGQLTSPSLKALS